MGYKILGFIVWKGAKWYVGHRVSSRAKRFAAAGAVGVGVGALLVAGASARQKHE
ncbi:MAG TPA: hypothetical protein VFG42_04050 [Baekduia sp.]|uniref:hypothetical protein n=1 Tax=Baekduia sp. TaxID=2600305 RepID=UPI002D7A3196|nr:hypothetical protein [Baekduia sp.]HET6505937.1 hypothetical protein [Baekduia sp.]